jgi:hypothetical protein
MRVGKIVAISVASLASLKGVRLQERQWLRESDNVEGRQIIVSLSTRLTLPLQNVALSELF